MRWWVEVWVYSIADMYAAASPPKMGTSAMRRVVHGRRFPGSGMSRNWRVHFVAGDLRLGEAGLGMLVDMGFPYRIAIVSKRRLEASMAGVNVEIDKTTKKSTL